MQHTTLTSGYLVQNVLSPSGEEIWKQISRRFSSMSSSLYQVYENDTLLRDAMFEQYLYSFHCRSASGCDRGGQHRNATGINTHRALGRAITHIERRYLVGTILAVNVRYQEYQSLDL
jgi:hypothetical protein